MPRSGIQTADTMIKTQESRTRYENYIVRKNPHLATTTQTKDFGFFKDVRLFRRMIGNPRSKLTNELQDLADFQVEYHQAIQDHHTVELLKSRKLGATETAITGFGLNAFDRYAGHDCMIIGGNKESVAVEILVRYDELFHDRTQPDGKYAFRHVEPELLEAGYSWDEAWSKGTKYYYNDLISMSRFGTDPVVRHKNDTRVMAFAASRQEKAQTFRGADDVIAAFLTEASHTGMKNDQPIMTALEPNLAQRDDGDLILETTGNGRRGFFYEYWMQTMNHLSLLFDIPINEHQLLVDTLHQKLEQGEKIKEVDWYPLMYDYTIGIKENILSKKYIEKQKRNPKLDFAQEYCCKFTSTYTQAIPLEDINYLDPNDPDYEKPMDYGSLLKDRDY